MVAQRQDRTRLIRTGGGRLAWRLLEQTDGVSAYLAPLLECIQVHDVLGGWRKQLLPYSLNADSRL